MSEAAQSEWNVVCAPGTMRSAMAALGAPTAATNTINTAEIPAIGSFMLTGISILASQLRIVYSDRLDCDLVFGSASPETVLVPMRSGRYAFQSGANL